MHIGHYFRIITIKYYAIVSLHNINSKEEDLLIMKIYFAAWYPLYKYEI